MPNTGKPHPWHEADSALFPYIRFDPFCHGQVSSRQEKVHLISTVTRQEQKTESFI